MLKIIRKGNTTTHGGSAITASDIMKFGGISIARKGDEVSCLLEGHGPTTIIEGNRNPDYHDCVIPVAFHGHQCGGGCTWVSSTVAVRVG